MRWEEMWDTAQRIRRRLVTAAWPPGMRDALVATFAARFGERPVAVRSSAPAEDDATRSFAGLHDTSVAVVGAGAIADHVVRVRASLWSDAAGCWSTARSSPASTGCRASRGSPARRR